MKAVLTSLLSGLSANISVTFQATLNPYASNHNNPFGGFVKKNTFSQRIG